MAEAESVESPQPQGAGVPWDTGNPLLTSGPSRLDTGTYRLPDGSTAGVLTVRTGSATVTVLLAPADLVAWHGVIGELVKQMGSSSSPPEPGANGSGPSGGRMVIRRRKKGR